MKKFLAVTILAILIGARGITAQPMGPEGPGPGMDGPPGKPNFEQMARDLDLTSDQQNRAKAMREKREPKIRSQMEKLRPMHDELRKILETEKVDLAKVRQQLKAIGDVMIEVRMLEIEGRLEFEGILTKEQATKLREMHRKRMDRDRPRPEHRPEGDR